MLNFLKTYWYILSITLLVVSAWFLKPGYIFATDLSWGPNPKIDLELSYGVVLQIFSWLGQIITQPLSEKILLTLPFVVMVVAGYKIGGKAVGTLAILNPFVYERLMVGQFNMLYAYSFTLGIIYFFKKWLYLKKEEKIEIKDVYIISILFSLSVLFAIHSIFIVSYLLLVLFLIFYKKIYSDILDKKISIKNIIKIFLIFFTPFAIVNSVWIYMMLTKGQSVSSFLSNISDQDFQAFATMGSDFSERTWNILNLQGFWAEKTKNFIIIKDSFLRFLPAIVVWILVVLGLLNLKNKNKLAFKILSASIVLIIILAQATSMPFIKNILYSIPFYSGLREPQKWVGLLTAILILILSILIKENRDTEKSDKEKIKIYKYIIVVTAFLWTPFLLWGGWGQIKVAEYPKFYQNLNSKLNTYDCYGGTMAVMPWHKYVEYNWNKRIVDNPAGFYFDCPVITGTNMELGGVYDNSNSKAGRQISQFVLSKGNSDLPQEIATILLFKDSDYFRYNFLGKYSIIEDNKDYTLYRVR